jgi:hypothetical protein
MHVREQAPAGAHEGGVSQHPHLKLHILSRFAGSVFQAEAEQIRPLGVQWRITAAIPYHPVASGKRRHTAIVIRFRPRWTVAVHW